MKHKNLYLACNFQCCYFCFLYFWEEGSKLWQLSVKSVLLSHEIFEKITINYDVTLATFIRGRHMHSENKFSPVYCNLQVLLFVVFCFHYQNFVMMKLLKQDYIHYIYVDIFIVCKHLLVLIIYKGISILVQFFIACYGFFAYLFCVF